jgi:hypothetical protein
MIRKKILSLLPISLIIIFSFAVRLYKLNSPIADWHSWRQADTSSVTRVFSQEGVDLFIPRYQDVSNIPSGIDNPEGYRMVEFPLYNLIHLEVFNQSHLSLEAAGRLTSVLLSTVSLLFVYLIALKISDKKTAIFSSLFFAFLPFNIFYSRAVLPEPLMVTLFLSSFYYLLSSHQEKSSKKRFSKSLLSALLLGFSLLIKPYAVFFSLPFLYIFLLKIKKKQFIFWEFLLYGMISLTPFVLWRSWIANFPSGIPAYQWLFNLNGIRFRPAWFRWLFAERLGKLILGYWGGLFLVLGILKKNKSPLQWSYHLFALGVLIYFSVIAGGNVTHDYYQAIVIPFIAFLAGRGVAVLTSLPKNIFSRPLAWVTAISVFVFSLAFSWYEIKGYYQINNPAIVEVGKIADEILPPDARVIAPYQGDTAFLYQVNRYGWPAIVHDLDVLIDQGATHYLSINYDDQTNKVIADPLTTIIEKTPQFVLLKLSK